MRRETKISILPGVSLLRRGLSFSLGAMLSLVVFSASVLAAKFTIPFSGRLTTADGMPLSGPVDLEVLFYDSSAGDKIRGLNAFPFLATKLSNGLFTVGIELSAEEVQLIFPDPHSETWIEITDHTNGRVYPRQRFNVVPYALKVPIDGNTITYNGDGVLSLGISTQPGTNEFLTKNSAGRLVWAAPADKTSTSLQGKNIDSAVPTTGQVLSFDGAKWVPKFVSTPSLSDISGVLVTAKGGTGLSAVPTNGQILIGNGAGYELSTLSAGSGISIENSSGSITISTSVVGTVTSVTAGNGLEGGPITATGSLSLANVGTAGTYAKVITDGYGRVTSGTSLTNSDITGTLGYTPLSRAGDSMSGALNIGGNDFQGVGNIQMSASKTLLLSSNSADPSGLVAGDTGKTWFNSTSKDIRYWDGSAVKTLGIAGSGLSNFNGQTGNSQTLANGTTGSAPAWSSASNIHTLNIPLASAGSVTAGLISNADYNNFSGKVTGVTSGTGVSVSTTGNIATVNLATAGTVGTYAKVTTDAYGRVTTGTTLSAGDLPPHSAALITSGTLAVANGGTGVTSNPANGQVLIGNGTAYSLSTLTAGSGVSITNASGAITIATSGVGSVTSVSAGTGLAGGPITSTGTLSLAAVGAAGTYVKVTIDAYGRVSSGNTLSSTDIPPISASLITSGTLNSAQLPTAGTVGTYVKVTTDAYGRVTLGTTLASGDVTSSLGYTPINKAGDTVSGALNFGSNDVLSAGNILMAASKTLALSGNTVDPTGLVNSDKGKTWFNSSTNQIKYWDGSAAVALGVAGAGLTSFNGQTGNTQTLAVPGTSGTAPTWSSAANAHTLNIPLASTASVTAGLISNADYNTFNAKVAGVSSGTGVSVSTTGNIATVNLATAGTVGTYAKVTTDAYGRVAAGTTLSAGDLPPHSAALITSGTLNTAQLPTIGTAGTYAKITTDAYGRVISGAALASGDVTSSLGFTPLNKAGDTMGGVLTLAANGLAAGTTQFVLANGNVGIGTTAPANKLSVSGSANFTGNVGIGVTSPGAGLDVRSTSAYALRLGNGDIGSGNQILFTHTGRYYPHSIRSRHVSATTSPGGNALDFYMWTAADNSTTAGTKHAMTLTGDGFVGIGTTVPIAPLSFPSTLGEKVTLWGTTAASNYGFGIQANLLQIHSDLVGSDIAFGYGSSASFTERMRIKGSGNVGIGTTSPSQLLEVTGNVALTGGNRLVQGAGWLSNAPGSISAFSAPASTGFYYVSGGQLEFVTNSADRVRIDTNGNVGIGTTSPTAKLQITGGQLAVAVPTTLAPSATSQTIDWNNGNTQVLSLASATGTVTLALNNPVLGASYALKVIQGSTARNVTWPATVKWLGGSVPTITSTISAIDLITMFYDGTNYLASYGQDYK